MKIADESLVFPKRLSAYFLAVKESIRDDPALSRLLERARLDLDVDKYPDNWNGGTYSHTLILYVPAGMFNPTFHVRLDGELFFAAKRRVTGCLAANLRE